MLCKGQLIICFGSTTITNYIDKNGITKAAINLNVKFYQFLGKSQYSLNKLSNRDQLTSNNQNSTVEDIVSSNPDIDSVF